VFNEIRLNFKSSQISGVLALQKFNKIFRNEILKAEELIRNKNQFTGTAMFQLQEVMCQVSILNMKLVVLIIHQLLISSDFSL
jgi:hypothetical protein